MDFFELTERMLIPLKGKLYVENLCFRLGRVSKSQLPSALSLLSEQFGGRDFTGLRSRFYRYWHGEEIRDIDLLESIDRILPGTLRTYRHPLWSALQMDLITPRQLTEIAQQLNPDIQRYILRYNLTTESIELKKGIRKHSNFYYLLDRRDLDALAYLLIALKHQDSDGCSLKSLIIRKDLQSLFIEMANVEPFNTIAIEIYQYVHRYLISLIPAFSNSLSKQEINLYGDILIQPKDRVIRRMQERMKNLGEECHYSLITNSHRRPEELRKYFLET